MRKVFFLFFLFTACVDVNVADSNRVQPAPLPYPGLDAGAVSAESAHFLVKAYSPADAKKYSDLAESLYSTVMSDLGLYSFAQKKPYVIIVYRDSSEFIAKTGSPKWSGGITAGNSILLFDQDRYPAIMAHEITHLVFNEFMENYSLPSYLFINEGLAVYEERKAYTDSDFFYRKIIEEQVKSAPLSFLQMTSFKPADGSPGVDKWYAQCSSVVGFMLRTQGGFKFYLFLKNLKSGMDLNAALKDAYPGLWQDSSDLENKWRQAI